ncbi:hypothetical protein D0Z03_001177 [Geotrichum reessii]|nr:hypothetical protein D0Z03_001177 [Galactomyces reessii]
MKDKLDPSSHAYNDPTSKYDTSTTTGKVKDKLDPSSHSYNDPTSKYDTSTTTGKVKNKLDPYSHERNFNVGSSGSNEVGQYYPFNNTETEGIYVKPSMTDDKGTKIYHTSNLGNTHDLKELPLNREKSSIDSSHGSTGTSLSHPTTESSQYDHGNDYLSSIPGGYPEKSYSSNTGADLDKNLTTFDQSDKSHNSSGFGETAHSAGAGLLAAGATATAGVAAVGNAAYNKLFGNSNAKSGTSDYGKANPDSNDENFVPVAKNWGQSGYSVDTSAPYDSSNYTSDFPGYTHTTTSGFQNYSDRHGTDISASKHDSHFNDPASKYDTSKLTGRVADKLDPNSRKSGTEASTGNEGFYDYNKTERKGDISPTLKYSDTSDKAQFSKLDTGHPVDTNIASASGNIPIARGEKFLSEEEKNQVQQHFSNVNKSLKPGQPEVAGVAVFPLTQEDVQNATPRSQKVESPSANTNSSTKKQNISQSGYDVRT